MASPDDHPDEHLEPVRPMDAPLLGGVDDTLDTSASQYTLDHTPKGGMLDRAVKTVKTVVALLLNQATPEQIAQAIHDIYQADMPRDEKEFAELMLSKINEGRGMHSDDVELVKRALIDDAGFRASWKAMHTLGTNPNVVGIENGAVVVAELGRIPNGRMIPQGAEPMSRALFDQLTQDGIHPEGPARIAGKLLTDDSFAGAAVLPGSSQGAHSNEAVRLMLTGHWKH